MSLMIAESGKIGMTGIVCFGTLAFVDERIKIHVSIFPPAIVPAEANPNPVKTSFQRPSVPPFDRTLSSRVVFVRCSSDAIAAALPMGHIPADCLCGEANPLPACLRRFSFPAQFSNRCPDHSLLLPNPIRCVQSTLRFAHREFAALISGKKNRRLEPVPTLRQDASIR